MAKYGFPEEAWDRAIDQAHAVLVQIARSEDLISYSNLCSRIPAIQLEPHSYAMREFLGEISTAEHHRGKGLLSVVVVYKHGDQHPGPGFFELARGLGYQVDDETQFWIDQLRVVYAVHRGDSP
ncbi:MAG: hypothetical protein KC588_15395 [Nitrospira sp.]|nr:hypothetical protein [Nitrospira sp.]